MDLQHNSKTELYSIHWIGRFWENERWQPFRGFGSSFPGHFHVHDPPRFSPPIHLSLSLSLPLALPLSLPLPPSLSLSLSLSPSLSLSLSFSPPYVLRLLPRVDHVFVFVFCLCLSPLSLSFVLVFCLCLCLLRLLFTFAYTFSNTANGYQSCVCVVVAMGCWRVGGLVVGGLAGGLVGWWLADRPQILRRVQNGENRKWWWW
jgi:hypothetical protein